MPRDLTNPQMRSILQENVYGHLGCTLEDRGPYVVPITYVYHGDSLYSFSFEGLKIEVMRDYPNVCVQVEELKADISWKSVIAWGSYEELAGEEHDAALNLLLDKLWKEGVAGKGIFVPFRENMITIEAALKDKGIVLFRINIDNMTGRYAEYR